jgi:hypothetical protein
LLEDAALRQRLGDNGPAFVAERFGLTRMLTETAALYGFDNAASPSAAAERTPDATATEQETTVS